MDNSPKTIDQVDINETSIREKMKTEIERFKKLQRIILGTKEKFEVNDIDVRNYARYLLEEGSIEEKREFTRCLKSEIVLKNKMVHINTKFVPNS